MRPFKFPDGQTAEIRDVTEVTTRNRRPIDRILMQLSDEAQAVMRGASLSAHKHEEWVEGGGEGPEPETVEGLGLSGADADLYLDLNDATISAFVARWSYPFAVDEDGIGSLTSVAYKALLTEIAPAAAQLILDVSPTEERDPAVPSGGSPT